MNLPILPLKNRNVPEKLLQCLLVLVFFSDCKNAAENLLANKKYPELAVYCLEHYSPEIKAVCQEGKTALALEIENWLSMKKDLPFARVEVPGEKHRLIEKYLLVDVAMGQKYRKLWNEFTQAGK